MSTYCDTHRRDCRDITLEDLFKKYEKKYEEKYEKKKLTEVQSGYSERREVFWKDLFEQSIPAIRDWMRESLFGCDGELPYDQP